MSQERIELVAAAGLLLLASASSWLLLAGADRVEARNAARRSQLEHFEQLRAMPLQRGTAGRLAQFDGLFGERHVFRVDTRFGTIYSVAVGGQLP